MKFNDLAPLNNARITSDGYMVVDAKVARSGIQEYRAFELGDVGNNNVVRVYRPESEVFSVDALKTYAYRPVTVGHPSEPVNSQNWKSLTVGQTGSDIVRDGDCIRVPMVIMDSSAIKDVQSGLREISMGYSAELEFVDGVTPDGQKYDAIQKNLVMNHLAIVAKARGGPELKIGDSSTKGSDMANEATKTKTVIVDGLPIDTTDAGAVAIDKLQKDVQTARTTLVDAEGAHSKALAAKDAEIDALKAKILTDAQIDSRVSARSDLIAAAKSVFPELNFVGKTDAEIRKSVVVAKLGDAAVAGKSEAYIDARYDILVDDNKDPVKKALADGHAPPTNLSTVYAERDAGLSAAWQNKTKA